MTDLSLVWIVMKWPLAACLVLPPLLGYLGLHVVRREVIFVDLALAQVAGDGTLSGKVAGMRRVGAARRAEIVLEDGLPSVEVTLPLEHSIEKGQELNLKLLTLRLFPPR